MAFNKFRLNIVIRLVLLTISISILVLFIVQFNYYFSASIVLIAVIAQVYGLYLFVDKVSVDISRFFNAIKYSDFTHTFIKNNGNKVSDELYLILNEVINSFRKISKENEEKQQFIQNVLQHIGIGLIACNKQGEIEISNLAAKKILKTGKLTHLNDIPDELEELKKMLFTIKNGEQLIYKSTLFDNQVQITLLATEFRLKDQDIKLISMQNIQQVLEEKELEAWQNLIRVLNHEIMNSITPIVSLASSATNSIEEYSSTNQLPDFDDLKQSVSIIRKRGENLLKFVNQYRSLTHIPRPSFKMVLAKEIIANIHLLFKNQIEEKNINLYISIEPINLNLLVDAEMIEQVLINLLVNSIDAVKNTENPTISIIAHYNNESRIEIEITDNGIGIEPDVLEKIFIPFFTTKKNGSGIGLSLSRQIMRLHGGAITINSIPNQITITRLLFN